jgi:hypothetical protein
VILIWGLLQDPTTRSVFNVLTRRGVPFTFIDHADVAETAVHYASSEVTSFRLTCPTGSCELTQMTAAYLRPYDYRHYLSYKVPGDDAPPRVDTEVLVHHLISAWADDTTALVVNRPSAEAQR